MACLPCLQNNTGLNSVVQSAPQECEYTIEFLNELLIKVETQLINNSQYVLFQAVVKSQINTYNTNCNLFADYINSYIIPLII